MPSNTMAAPSMKSNPSTATALASNRRKLRLAGRTTSPGVQVPESRGRDAEVNASSPSSTSQSSKLSPAARRRLTRRPNQQHQSSHTSSEVQRRQSQHVEHEYSEEPPPQQQSFTQLNLHCADSVDSDDNGTCFNSIGTTTPRYPPSTSSPPTHQEHIYSDQEQTHLTPELRINAAEYESKHYHQQQHDGYDHTTNSKLSPLAEQISPHSSQHSHRTFFSPKNVSIWDSTTSRPNQKGENHSAYSEFDHSSAAAATATETLQKKHSQRNRGGNRSLNRYPNNTIGYNNISYGKDGEDSRYGDTHEMNEFLNKPHVKAAIGVGAAATICATILGPVGLLVGVASAGIGMGVLQIPEEQRNNVCNHATTSLSKARDVALELSDTVSASCGKCANDEDPVEVVEEVRKEFIDTCCSGIDEQTRNMDDDGSLAWRDKGIHTNVQSITDIKPAGSSPIAAALNHSVHNVKGLVGDVFGDETPSPVQTRDSNAMLSSDDDGMPRVACCRKGRVVPLGQIHSLRPSLQPRAWLDVMASAHTTRDDKNEAMEEILILAKDKDISRWFLEEGILDSLMYILSSYFRNYSAFLRNEPPVNETQEPSHSFKPGGNAFFHAKLAANCCVALGKAHCAAVHTDGDLLLMSAYSRGSVPVERQLAQMLFEVPHHMKVINPSQSNSGGAANNDGMHDHPEFTLTELSMQQAEDLASSIKSLDDGNIDV